MQKLFIVLLCFLASPIFIRAQTPYSWTFDAKKTGEKTYEIHCTVDVNPPWHTYSQFTPDGGPLPTKFTFSKNPLYSLDGPVAESGKMLVRHEDVFGVDVKYFNGRVDFVQKLKMRGGTKTNFAGTVEFMVCNDQQCLPPKTQKFSVSIY
jgi:hypothetical protein